MALAGAEACAAEQVAFTAGEYDLLPLVAALRERLGLLHAGGERFQGVLAGTQKIPVHRTSRPPWLKK